LKVVLMLIGPLKCSNFSKLSPECSQILKNYKIWTQPPVLCP
jgi:hypothetical protein